MLPTGLSAFLLLLVFVPGWAYLAWMERVRPAAGRRGLSELLEVVAMGVATTGPAILLLILIPHRALPFTIDLEQWADGGAEYLASDLDGLAWSAVLVLGVALLMAYLLYRMQRRGRSKEFHPEAGVWARALGARPRGKVPWVGIMLKDGRLVEGVLHSFTLNDIGDDRDVALGKPIRVTETGQSVAVNLPALERFVVSAREIEYMTVVEAPEARSR